VWRQVFKNLMGDTEGERYTNAQLWERFSPNNRHLPYVYDDFKTWGSCDRWNACSDC
jgi:hypothetical protein